MADQNNKLYIGLPKYRVLYIRVKKRSSTHPPTPPNRKFFPRTPYSPDVGHEAAAQHADGRLELIGPSVQHFDHFLGA